MRTTPIFLTLLAALSLLPACATRPAPGSTPAYARTWNLITIDGDDVFTLLPDGQKGPSLTIAPDGKITGYTGMNTLSTTVDPAMLNRGNFKFGNAVTTGRTGSPQQTIVESAFLTDLAKADYFTIHNGLLTFSNSDQKLLVFAAVDTK